MPEFTQEQIDEMLAKVKSEAREGLFTEDDLNKRVTSEVDRRVESGIQKGLETRKAKWEEEFTKKAQMSAEELAQKEVQEKLKEVSGREQEISKRANQLEAKEMLNEAGIPKAQYEKVITMLVSADGEATKANVTNFINVFNETKSEIETKVKAEFTKIPPPKQGNGDKATTKDDFNKMPYGEKMKFKETHPELYKEFIK